MSILEVRNLSVEFAQRDGSRLRAVDNVSFELQAGETLALVGRAAAAIRWWPGRCPSCLRRPAAR